MEELVAYDPHLVVGILGGGAGTTYDAFKLIAEAQKYGARVALFGRKINNAECQLAFVEFLRRIVDGEVTPEEAVRAYHGVLEQLKIKPQRSLADDMQLQSGVMSYGGSSSASVPSGVPRENQEARGKVIRRQARLRLRRTGSAPVPLRRQSRDFAGGLKNDFRRQARLRPHDHRRKAGLQQSQTRSDLRLRRRSTVRGTCAASARPPAGRPGSYPEWARAARARDDRSRHACSCE